MFNKQAISINRKIKFSLYKLRHQQIEDLDDFHELFASLYKNVALCYVERISAWKLYYIIFHTISKTRRLSKVSSETNLILSS